MTIHKIVHVRSCDRVSTRILQPNAFFAMNNRWTLEGRSELFTTSLTALAMLMDANVKAGKRLAGYAKQMNKGEW